MIAEPQNSPRSESAWQSQKHVRDRHSPCPPSRHSPDNLRSAIALNLRLTFRRHSLEPTHFVCMLRKTSSAGRRFRVVFANNVGALLKAFFLISPSSLGSPNSLGSPGSSHSSSLGSSL